ncbi:hypothetical protein H2509_20610 [Stappia sp. F7233]|uniref:Glycoside hydrolase family 19 catalytic domain-containing protein n=1 Tax=Stappia albiluteola TaxID=2758565 RepID=A0A839AL03_9HYPH|nr:glycoside hydrolase family 19 protein [Stappia albiluteola]MBA5779129.1 hypothetical protein [Stappia albiluteola]MBA5779540.1 hypothetical protein [Stappia albiluteola]
MNRTGFFEAIRKSLFGGHLTQSEVDGINVILDQWRDLYPDAPAHWIANSLAQIHHETGGRMVPIKETVQAYHKDANPHDITVESRLDAAFAKGQLPWVRTPYWRDGWFGRGLIQITHRDNYARLGRRLGVDLVGNRNLALDPVVSAQIAIVGMVDGLFTGKRLADYHFPAALEEPEKSNPRRIVNGKDGKDMTVAALHRRYFEALQRAAYEPRKVVAVPPPPDIPKPEPKPQQPAASGLFAALVKIIAALFERKTR